MAGLTDDLNTLHNRLVWSVNSAVADDDLDRAECLAADYDEEASVLIALHDGPTEPSPEQRPVHVDSGLRARLRRLTHSRAA